MKSTLKAPYADHPFNSRRASWLAGALVLSLAVAACGDDDESSTNGTDDPLAGLTVTRQSMLTNQEGPETSGDASIATDTSGKTYVVLGKNFMSDFSSGTVTVYLAKTDDNLGDQRDADASSVSAKLGNVNENGAHRFEIPAGIDANDFDYVVIWCETAAINFAAGKLSGSQSTADTTLRSGTLTNQEGPQTTGSFAIVKDKDGKNMLTLGDDFMSNFDSGTVTVYLAKTDDNLGDQRDADASSVSAKVGNVNENGAHRFELPAGVGVDDFDYVIIWCETAAINFAAGQLSGSESTADTTLRSGTLTNEEGPQTTGSFAIVNDKDGKTVLTLGDDFMSNFDSGTVTVYLAKTGDNLDDQRNADTSSVSAKVGNVNENGMHRFELPAGVGVDDFDYVVIWCETVAINFAAGQLYNAS